MASATILTTNSPREDDNEYVFFHSGGVPTYRKVVHRANSQEKANIIPTIDISEIDTSIEARKKLAKEIYHACTTSGFFYLSGHGVPEELLNGTFDLMKRFFALDHETKMDAHVQKNPAIRGYEPMFETRLDPRTQGDIKEAFTMGDDPLEPEQEYTAKTGNPPPAGMHRPLNTWPREAPWWREGLYKYYNTLMPLSLKVIRLMALAFDLEETAFDHYFKFPITGIRTLHYPPMPKESEPGAVGLGAHSDNTWLTMVLQDQVPALEILSKDGVWIAAEPKPNTFVCNVGRFLERVTNSKFIATVHRVRNMTGERRYSLAFFQTPDPDAVIKVLDCCLEPGEGPKQDEDTVGDLYVRRVLPARPKHPKSNKYQHVPVNELKYDLFYTDI
ncbi:hypothetical protein A1O1_02689 [Capronia coronata CBS 617.96]|uniref:Fe2OG dioxygenase domain-containing protein n=1 Tax=Capronia coronata CBS 617.96 TaxID=1182541 RepID=W9YX70_9EURO|nr:uncharacterized protein A1O1_02689 [Capronia coronata CBS 617.96]EXJ94295.1 hypothetical protein A1O1_02689 [Capronia coronata CBS 617.96]